MRLLREFAQSEQVRAFLGGVEERVGPAVQGVHVDYDQYWLTSWLLRLAWRRDVHPAWLEQPLWMTPRRFHYVFDNGIEAHYRPDDWQDYCRTHRQRDDAHPIVLRIILRHAVDREMLPDANMIEGHAIEYQVRPIARAAALALPSLRKMRSLVRPWEGRDPLRSGSSVSGTSHGTLGGFNRPRYVRSDLSRGGDSGAWVLGAMGPGVGATWDGMVVAGDGGSTYATFATNIVEALGSKGMAISLMT